MISGFISNSDQEEIAQVVADFPAVFEKAVEYWAKFKVGLDAGLFSDDQIEDVIDWYREFPKLWETIRPNFESNKTFMNQVDGWVSRVSDRVITLGIAPLVIAGVLVAAIFGIGGAIWAVGYVKKQNNVNKMIDGVTAGSLPAEVLTKAVEVEKAGIFSQVTDLVYIGVVGAALYLAYPFIKKVFVRG